jgi:hypothetical protein
LFEVVYGRGFAAAGHAYYCYDFGFFLFHFCVIYPYFLSLAQIIKKVNTEEILVSRFFIPFRAGFHCSKA